MWFILKKKDAKDDGFLLNNELLLSVQKVFIKNKQSLFAD